MRIVITSTIAMLALVALAITVVETTRPPEKAEASVVGFTTTKVGDLIQILFIDKAGNPANATGACSSPAADNLAHGLTGYKFGSSALAYKTKTSTFPTYLASADVQAAINAAFSTVDAATAKALFTNGGATTAAINKKDGTNTIGFASMNSGTVGMAYAWYNSKTKTIVEFDIALSTAYTWATNAGKTGDCGGSTTAFDIQDIMTHEVGHPVGLNDVTATGDSAQSMYGYGAKGELYKRDLAGGDKKGVTTLYGN